MDNVVEVITISATGIYGTVNKILLELGRAHYSNAYREPETRQQSVEFVSTFVTEGYFHAERSEFVDVTTDEARMLSDYFRRQTALECMTDLHNAFPFLSMNERQEYVERVHAQAKVAQRSVPQSAAPVLEEKVDDVIQLPINRSAPEVYTADAAGK